jgi:hypothetical protein
MTGSARDTRISVQFNKASESALQANIPGEVPENEHRPEKRSNGLISRTGLLFGRQDFFA